MPAKVKPGKAARAARVAQKAEIEGTVPVEEKTPSENPQVNVETKDQPIKVDTTVASSTEGAEKSKADLRRERKAIQEAQRAKKVAGDGKKPQTAQQQQPKPEQTSQQAQKNPSPPKETKSQDPLGKKIDTLIASQENNKSKLFHHFEQFNRDYSIIEKCAIDNPAIHPAFIKLGVERANDSITGSNERCLAFLDALLKFIKDYKAPNSDGKTISKDLDSKLKPNINFLRQCRPFAIGVANAIKQIKQVILYLPNDITETDAKEVITEEIERFIDEKILLAWETISKYMLADSDTVISGNSYVKSKITNDDCILIYGGSSLVTHLMIQASHKFPKMRVIVVDSRPNLRGKKVMETLVKHGVNCTYVLINGISFIMNKVTKVIMGSHALLGNGYVMSTMGSSQVALVAKSFNVPVVICCETYKFCEKVQTDGLTNNELDNPMNMLYSTNNKQVSPLIDWRNENKESDSINILNLAYDITSPNFISCVVTDMGMLPCTSVAVVLRLKNRDSIQMGMKKESASARGESSQPTER